MLLLTFGGFLPACGTTVLAVKIRVIKKFVFSHQNCYGPENYFRIKGIMSLFFVLVSAYLSMCVLIYRAYRRGWEVKKLFSKIAQFEQEIGFSERFPKMVQNFSFLSYQASS